MKILILRFSSIGDIVLTTPVIRTLKEQLEGAAIHYCTKKEYQGLVNNNPHLDKVHVLDDSMGELIKELKAEKFDYIIDLHHNLRTARIKFSLSAKAYSFNKLNWEKWLYVKLKINRLPNRHIVDRYMDTVAPLGVKMDNRGLDYYIPEKDEVELDWLPEEYRGRYVALAIGAHHATKRLPVERLIELCDRINKPVVLLGGKEDAAVGERVASFFERPEHSIYEQKLTEELNKRAIVFNGCGKFNLNQSAYLVKKSIAQFTHDTGLMHIGAAFRKPVYSIWGNTVPEFGMYPYRTKFTVFENNSLSCRPCSKIGHSKCPKGHFKCMKDVKFDFYIP